MYHDFLGPRGLQGTHMDTLKPKKSKSIAFTVRGGFFTSWAILAMAMASSSDDPIKGQLISKGLFGFFNSPKKQTKHFCPSAVG